MNQVGAETTGPGDANDIYGGFGGDMAAEAKGASAGGGFGGGGGFDSKEFKK